MNITRVEPETLEALNEQVAEVDRPVTEVPWWEFDPDDSHQQERVSFIEQFPNGKGAEPVVTDDGVNQSGFANFWEIGPELPPQPKTPNIRTDEPEDHGKELSKNPPQLERFSNLTETLKGIEAKHIEAGPLGNEAIAEARLAVVRAIEQFRLTRFNLGKTLCAYRALFMASRGRINCRSYGLRRTNRQKHHRRLRACSKPARRRDPGGSHEGYRPVSAQVPSSNRGY
jgi:hypothetical protein